MKCFLLLLLVSLVPILHGARILAVYPSFLRSHLTVVEGILEELANREHEITLISAFRFRNQVDNMERKREIHIEGLDRYFQETGLSDLFTRHTSAIEDVSKFVYAAAEIVNFTMSDAKVQALLQSKEEQFDLVLVDHFLNDAFLGFGLIYDAPVVLSTSTVMNKWVERAIGNPHNPAYNPHLFLGYTSQMSFWQRIINVVVSVCEDFSYDLLYLPVQQSMYQRFFGKYTKNGDSLPPLEELIKNVSLALVNSDRAFHGSRALVANVVEIGGVHAVHQPTKPLPKEIDHYFSIADDGIFLWTLGANTKPSTIISKDKLATINHVFRSIPTAAVFVRWEDRLMEYQSDNVVIGQWIPQTDMMAHPKVRLLITNGGLLSIYEAIYYKKPLLGIPLFGDQFQNMALVEQHGIGRILDMDTLTNESFREVLDDVRNNPRYQENINRLHELMFELGPVEDKLMNAVVHIEYVIRTKGAGHLKSPALALSVWQIYLVDVTLTLILIVVLILAVPAIVIGVMLRRANLKYDERPRAKQQLTGTMRSSSNREDASDSLKFSATTTITSTSASSSSNSAASSSANTPTTALATKLKTSEKNVSLKKRK